MQYCFRILFHMSTVNWNKRVIVSNMFDYYYSYNISNNYHKTEVLQLWISLTEMSTHLYVILCITVLNRYMWQKVIYSNQCRMELLISCVLHTPDRTVLFIAVHKNTNAQFQRSISAALYSRGCIVNDALN